MNPTDSTSDDGPATSRDLPARRSGSPSPRGPRGVALRLVALLAALVFVRGAAADTQLYVTNLASNGSWEILRYSSSTGAYAGRFTTLPGASFGLAVGPDRNVYVTDFDNRRVDRYDGASGAFMNTFATWSGSYGSGYDVTFGPDGNMYVGVDGGDVLKFNGTTGASLGRFIQAPSGVFGVGGLAFRGDNMLFVSYGGSGAGNNGKLYAYNATTGGDAQLVYGSFTNNGPKAPAFDGAGNIYVPDYQTPRILKFSASTFTLSGTISTVSPYDIGFKGGELLVLTDNGSASTIRRYDASTGASLGTLVQSGSGGLGRAFTLTQVTPVPEIDPAGVASVFALVTGVIGLIERRRSGRG